MKEIEKAIIEAFESKSANFKKSLIKEFLKSEPIIVSFEMYKYRHILIYNLFEETTKENDRLFNDIDNPLEIIEITLFNYIKSKNKFDSMSDSNDGLIIPETPKPYGLIAPNKSKANGDIRGSKTKKGDDRSLRPKEKK